MRIQVAFAVLVGAIVVLTHGVTQGTAHATDQGPGKAAPSGGPSARPVVNDPAPIDADVARLEAARAAAATPPAWGPALAEWAVAAAAGDAATATAALARVRATPGYRRERIFMLPPSIALASIMAQSATKLTDPVALDALWRPFAETLPFVREAKEFAQLADVLTARGRPDLAATWRSRVDSAESSFMNDSERVRPAMLSLGRVALALLLALPIFGLVFGVGLGARARGPSGPAVLHAIGLMTLLFCATLAIGALAGQIDTLRKHASVPAALLYDDWRSPEVIAWIGEDVREPVRTTVLNYAKAEAMVSRGQHATVAVPTDATMRQALGPTRGMADRMGDAATQTHLSSVIGHPGPLAPIDTLVRALIALLVAFGVGLALGRFVPASVRIVQIAVPGASRWLGPLGGLVLAAVIAGVVGLMIGVSWAMWSLAAGLILHMAGILLDRRLQRIGDA